MSCRKNILITFANKDELGKGFSISLQKNTSTFLFEHGVGIPNTIWSLSQYLAKNQHFQAILSVGFGGCFSFQKALGSAVFVTDDQFSGLGTESPEGFISLDALGFAEKKELYFSSEKETIFSKEVQSLCDFSGSAITRFACSGKQETIEALQKKHPKALIESMEGAAVHFVASKFKIPVIQVRVVSNHIEPRTPENWDISSAKKCIQEILTALFTE